MARIIGDTTKVGTSYVRVTTEKTRDSVVMRNYSGLRHAKGSKFSIPKKHLTDVINLLLRAEKEMDNK